MWWTVVELLPPTRDDNTLTRWIPPMSRERAQELELLNQILIPGTHYEVNASSEDLYRLVETFADSEHYAVYPSDASSPELQRFRSQWILRRRQRPVVPAPKGPMPHRGLTDSERRGMLCSLYFRPWVLLRSSATSRVVHLMNLDLVTLRRPDDPDYAQPMGRQRLRSKMNPPRWSQRSYKDAWTRYIRGNIVTDHAKRYIQNFLLVMAGTGKHEREDEEGQGTRRKREDMGNPGTKMNLEEMQQVLREAPRTTTAGSDEKLTAIGKRIHNSMAVVQRLLQHKQGEAGLPVLHAQRAIAFNRSAPEAKAKAKAAAKNANRPKALQVEIFHREWTKPYKTWRKRLEGLKEPPYAAQWIFMNAVHKRCTEEAEEERRGTLKKIQIPDSEPARLLCHGLPGSGKTQVMKWLAQYFQEVWSWEQGVHFVYLAPMNSMAARINGSTVHSWGEVPWAMDGPSGTMTMASGSTDLRDMSSMSTKMELCRWMFIDEVEAVGAEILGILEQHTAEAARKRLYQFRGGRARPEDLRPFGGLNTGLFGDFWQLPPVRQINIRSNPFRDRSTSSHQARKMLTFFWGQDPLNSFTQPPIELSVCKRIKDKWYSGVIDQCRVGAMADDNYNFLHGYPTKVCGTWLSKETPSTCGNGCEQVMMEQVQQLRAAATGQHGNGNATATGQQTPIGLALWTNRRAECPACQAERKRRKRVIDDDATAIDPEFALAPLVTAMNKPRYLASQQRAQIFARYKRTQVLWVQAEDFPISGEIATYDDAMLNKRRRDWLKRHDQSTSGIMGLLPLVKDLPIRFTVTVDKKRNIFKFTPGKIVGWTLDPVDVARVENSTEEELMLEKLPPMIYIQRDGEGMPQHLDLEPEVYGLRPRGMDWPVDPSQKENWVKRFGFPIVPDFAATVHAVTGGQLSTAIGDLDTFDATPSQEDSLKGYIVLSRVETADKILLAQPFSPTLFTQGPLESAELLLEVLRGKVPKDELEARWDAIEANWKKRKPRLMDQQWECGVCQKKKAWEAFVPARSTSTMSDDINTYILKPGAWRCCIQCLQDDKTEGAAPAVKTQLHICEECKEEKLSTHFGSTKLMKKTLGDFKHRALICDDCDEMYKPFLGKWFDCVQCKKEKIFNDFHSSQKRRIAQGHTKGRKCTNCLCRECKSCSRREPPWGATTAGDYYCKACPHQKCATCKTMKPLAAFSPAEVERRVRHETYVCTQCQRMCVECNKEKVTSISGMSRGAIHADSRLAQNARTSAKKAKVLCA